MADNRPLYKTGAVMDAPDLATRTAYMKLQSGAKIGGQDFLRLANRMSIEDENARTGGGAKGTLPRASDPNDAYSQGYGSTMRAYGSAPQQPKVTPRNVRPVLGQPDAQSNPNVSPVMPVRPQPGFGGGVINIGGKDYGATPQTTTANPVPSSPITPSARERNNPLTGDNSSIPQGATQDLGVNNPNATHLSPSGPLSRSNAPQVYYGGFGEHRQPFQKAKSAQLYDTFVRDLFSNPAGAETQPLDDQNSVLQRAPAAGRNSAIPQLIKTPVPSAPQPDDLTKATAPELSQRFFGGKRLPQPLAVTGEVARRVIQSPSAAWNARPQFWNGRNPSVAPPRNRDITSASSP